MEATDSAGDGGQQPPPPTNVANAANPAPARQPAPDVPPQHNFRGHPQPPANKRLQNAINFLADEDPERCIGFETKISEIEEYLKVIKQENVDHNDQLFKEVKIMVNVHRDWQKRIAEGPRNPSHQDGPAIQPYSTRLVSAETREQLEAARAAFGFTNQTRDDHAPFNVDRQDDQADFIRALNDDAERNPAEVVEDTNLLYVESRAYGWATRDPALIPVWMHPTNGIPKRGLKSADEAPWYRAPNPPSEIVRNRPIRGWLPSYLVKLENDINRILKKRDPTVQEWSLLEEMITLLEPEPLQHLHNLMDDLIEAERIGYLGNRQAELDHAISDYQIAQNEWIGSFQKDGVFFILRRPGDDEDLEVDPPGVFYINDGFRSQLHQENETRINGILTRSFLPGQPGVIREDKTILDNLLRIVCPDTIRDLREQRTAILMRAGANSWEDLSGTAEIQSNAILAQINTDQTEWENRIRTNQAQFIYLRLGERLPERGNETLLYLPWNLTVLPTSEIPLRRDLRLSPEIMDMQQQIRVAINSNMSRNISSLEMQPALINSAYPELRSLLIPWMAIKRKHKHGGTPTDDELRLWDILDPIVKQLAASWLSGFDERLIFKMPLVEQKQESPRHLYWRGDVQDFDAGWSDQIQDLRHQISQGANQQVRDSLKELLRQFQYPALQRVDENRKSAVANTQAARNLERRWDRMYNRWISSKDGFRLEVSQFEGYFDRDDDPSVIYYRGPLPVVGDLALSATENVREYLAAYLGRAGSIPNDISAEIRQDLPPEVENAFRTYEQLPNHNLEPVLRWYFQTLVDTIDGSVYLTDHEIQLEVPTTPTNSGELPPLDDLPPTTPPSFSPRSPEFYRPRSPYLTTNILAATHDLPTPPTTPENLAGGSTVNPNLQVDLSLAITQLTSLELAINRSLGWLRANADWTTFDFRRLWKLLSQFYPDNVRRAQLDVEDHIARRGAEVRSNTALESDPQYHQLYEIFRKRQFHWLKKNLLKSPTWRIRLANETQLDGLLTFNSSVTGKGPACVIKAPDDGSNDQSEIRDINLSPQQPDVSPEILQNIDRLLNGPSGINPLLLNWKNKTITFEESDILLTKLLAVMPPSLSRQESELRTLDTIARAEQLTSEEQNMEFWNLWNSWHEAYEVWLKSLDPRGVVIGTGDLNLVDNTRTLRLQNEDFINIPNIVRARTLPYPVRQTLGRMRILLNSARAPLNDEEVIELDLIMRNIWRGTGQRLRSRLHTRISHDFNLANENALDEDHLIIVETLLAEAYSLFKVKATVSASSTAEIEEPLPGEYVFYYSSDTVPRGECVDLWLDEAFQILFLGVDVIDKSRRNFYDLARRFRGGFIPDQNEIARLADYFQPLSKTDLIRLYDQAYIQAVDVRDGNPASNAPLVRTETALLWYRWAFGNASTDLKALDTIRMIKSQPSTPDDDPRLERLQTGLTHILVDELVLMLSLAGTAPRGPNPRPLPSPSTHQIRETEIEVNNLLERERTGIITQIQLNELNYLLRGVMDIALRNLQQELVRLDSKFVQQPGLEPRQTLTMAAAINSFNIRFNRFKADLPRFGVILDQWWYKEEEITEICSRARMWREATSYDSSTSFPTCGENIESSRLAEWHRVYALLASFMADDCPENTPASENLLLRFLPERLAGLPAQIRTEIINVRQIELQNNVREFRNSRDSLLRSMQEDFITSFMGWYISLPASTLKSLRNQAAARYIGPVDFTTKAERRGIQRAAIELALNTIATNQEQHRPQDRFRIVDLPEPYRPAPPEVLPTLPLEPSRRPLELDPFDYTKKLLAYREWKDHDYEVARDMSRPDFTEILKSPLNFLGPFTIPGIENLKAAKQAMLATLTGIVNILRIAYEKAPRPLLAIVLHDIQEGMFAITKGERITLTREHIDLLRSLAEPSWDNERQPYDENIPHITGIDGELSRLQEFEKEIEKEIERNIESNVDENGNPNGIPLWTPEGVYELVTQRPYDPTQQSTQVISLRDLINSINNARIRTTGPQQTRLAIWSYEDSERYLTAMAMKRRIHLNDRLDDLPENRMVSRIPLSGHPENKYITLMELGIFEGVQVNGGQQAQIRYDKFGTMGPPILQPNKITHFRRIADELGRRTMELLEELAQQSGVTLDNVLTRQNTLMTEAVGNMDLVPHPDNPDANAITIDRLALDLLRIAPDLADEAGFDFQGDPEANMTLAQAAMLLQMQLVEESNNNWEFRFPEDEHVWNFATDRITPVEFKAGRKRVWHQSRPTQYFSMRRHPPAYQSAAVQTMIKNSGPDFQEKPQPQTRTHTYPGPQAQVDADGRAFAQARAAANNAGVPLKVDRHIKGQVPTFPFGETPYQSAYLSFRMQDELKDVPELQAPAQPRPGFFTRKRKRSPSPVNRYALPKLPTNWQPNNTSFAEARFKLTEAAIRAPGFPNADDLEYYYTQDEITDIRRRQAWLARRDEIEQGVGMIERDTGRIFEDLTAQEVYDAQTRLGIDHLSGRVIARPDGIATPANTGAGGPTVFTTMPVVPAPETV